MAEEAKEALLAVKVAEPCMRLHICEMDEQDFCYEISIYLPHSIHLSFSGPVVSVLMAGLHHSPKPERQISATPRKVKAISEGNNHPKCFMKLSFFSISGSSSQLPQVTSGRKLMPGE